MEDVLDAEMHPDPTPIEPSIVPSFFIRVVHHPHSQLPDKIIPLDQSTSFESDSDSSISSISNLTDDLQPWRPFQTRADFEFAESVVVNRLNKETINVHLQGMHGGWHQGGKSNITFHSHQDILSALEKARKLDIPVSHTLFI
jgi:hypothetical protein